MIGKLGLSWMFLLIFWGRGLLHWFSGVFPGAEFHPLCQRARLSVNGSILLYVVLFYYLKAFSMIGVMKMVVPQSLAPELNNCRSHSSVHPQGEVVNPFCV